MSFQDKIAKYLNSMAVGRLAYRAAQPILHVGRRIAHPHISPHQDVCKVTCRGKQFNILHRRTSVDKQVIYQCFDQEQYDMPKFEHGVLTERRYQQIIAAGKQPLIVDCGANIGASVLWFSARYPQAHILAVEPAKDNFALLQINTAGLDVDLRNAGIDATDGLAHLMDDGSGAWGYRTASSGSGPEIAMVTVASLLASKPAHQFVPFLLKIDIEGAEQSLFAGDCSAINRFPLIVVELHDWLFPGQGSSLPFFRFHVATGREFSMKNENVASIDLRSNPAQENEPGQASSMDSPPTEPAPRSAEQQTSSVIAMGSRECPAS